MIEVEINEAIGKNKMISITLKIDNFLKKIHNKEKEKRHIFNIGNERGDITTDPTDIEMLVKKYKCTKPMKFEHLHTQLH